MPETPGVKQRRQTERLLASQYVAEMYPGERAFIQQYVGPIVSPNYSKALTAGERAALGVNRRRADVVIPLKDKLLVIESYVHVQLGKLSQLLTYMQLAPLTPELEEYWRLPVAGVLVGAQRDPVLDTMAAKFDVPVVIYQPKWVVDYLATVARRHGQTRTDLLAPQG